MPQVSKYPISKKVEERIFELFSKGITKLSRPSQIDSFLNAFLSPVERMMLSKRFSIAVLLLKGYKYPEIRKVLRVSPPTISSVSLALKYLSPEFRKTIEDIVRDETREEFWNSIIEAIEDRVPPGGRNWSIWRFEREKKKRERRKDF